MADIVLSSKKKVNLFDRVIQSVVIMVNMNKMNRAIDEHLSLIKETDRDDQRQSQENILREIVFVKYQYDIMQREAYELKMNYPEDVVLKINSTDKTERFELQLKFLELEYDRITKSKFRSREDVKFGLLAISSAMEAVKQNIKDEGKAARYNKLIKIAEDIDTKIQTEEYQEEDYKELFAAVDEYVGFINDSYDISKLPSDERELIEFVIETMIKGIESDIDRHMYEYNLIINICKNSYRYFKVVDKIFEKLQRIYDESLESDILSLKDYIKMYKEIYDMKIKAMVNDVHRTIKTEDEYLEYSKLVTDFEYEKMDEFILSRAAETTNSEYVTKKFADILEVSEDDIKKGRKERLKDLKESPVRKEHVEESQDEIEKVEVDGKPETDKSEEENKEKEEEKDVNTEESQDEKKDGFFQKFAKRIKSGKDEEEQEVDKKEEEPAFYEELENKQEKKDEIEIEIEVEERKLPSQDDMTGEQRPRKRRKVVD